MAMQDLREVYKINEEDRYPYFGGGYIGLIKTMGVEIVEHASDGSYQGDAYVLVKEGDRYGWLVYGWGSCSGCDAFEAAQTIADIEDLRTRLYTGIFWGTLEEVVAHAGNAKDAGRYYAGEHGYEGILQRMRDRAVQANSAESTNSA